MRSIISNALSTTANPVLFLSGTSNCMGALMCARASMHSHDMLNSATAARIRAQPAFMLLCQPSPHSEVYRGPRLEKDVGASSDAFFLLQKHNRLAVAP